MSRSRLIPGWTDALMDQLERLESFDRLGGILKELHECRLAVSGGDYLYWDRSSKPYSIPKKLRLVEYHSSRKVLLSIDPFSTQSRRVPVSPGPEPPKFAPNASTIVR